VQLAYVDQSRADARPEEHRLEGDLRRLDIVNARQARGQLAPVRLVVQLQGLRPAEAVGELSGGERNRVHLAKLLKSGGNLLLLDEPTNDLDVDTLRALEDALLDFAGCAVVISHDRWFLDRIATHILAFEGDSQVTWFEGTRRAPGPATPTRSNPQKPALPCYNQQMLTAERRQAILARLERDGRVVASELVVSLGVSEDTVRRDLRELAEQGLLHRVHGGALPPAPGSGVVRATGSRLGERRRSRSPRPRCRLLEGARVIVLDGGTTTLELARRLPAGY
jgi:ATPase subunit of ABC transporter with duplicated ATPase domains